MAAEKHQIDPLVQKLVVDGMANLITQIQNDIKREEKLSRETQENCNAILTEARLEYVRIEIAFMKQTKILVEKALIQPDKKYHKTWLHILDIYTSLIEKLAAPILLVLNSLSLESARLKAKYNWMIAGGVSSTMIGTGLSVFLLMHFIPACTCVALPTAGVAATIIGILVAAGAAMAFYIGAMNINQFRETYNKCGTKIQLIWARYMPNLFGNSSQTVTQEDLEQAIKEALNMFKIKEQIWIDNELLEMMQQSLDGELTALVEKQQDYIREKHQKLSS